MSQRPASPGETPRDARRRTPALAPATLSEWRGVRYLHLGTPWVQGAMRLRRPAQLELEYIRRMMVWMLLRPIASVTDGHAVQLGLGAAAITRYCHAVLGMRSTAVELNPTVIDACHLWFELPMAAPGLAVLELDAADYVGDPKRAGSADVLCVDLYDHEAASPMLDSAVFYADCHRLLAEGGVMSVNLFGRDASFTASAARIAATFGNERVRTLSPTKEGNSIVVAIKNTAIAEPLELAARAENIETRFGLPARKWLRLLHELPATSPSR